MRTTRMILISGILFLLLGGGPACADSWLTDLFDISEKIHGSGDIVSEDRQVRDFTWIEVNDDINLYVRVGDERSIKVVADDNLMSRLRTRVKHHTLKVGFKGRCVPTHATRVVVTIPELERIELNGSGDCEIEKLGGRRFKITVKGSSDVLLSGGIEDLIVRILGSGNINAHKLLTEHSQITIMGSGDIDVNASATLDITILGSGDIDVYGNPEIVDKCILGSGEVRIHR
ncbi:MAG: DUF2807 domain-containing protein [bacterium]|nr:DUF2807 domain-containing protein [bacterium]